MRILVLGTSWAGIDYWSLTMIWLILGYGSIPQDFGDYPCYFGPYECRNSYWCIVLDTCTVSGTWFCDVMYWEWVMSMHICLVLMQWILHKYWLILLMFYEIIEVFDISLYLKSMPKFDIYCIFIFFHILDDTMPYFISYLCYHLIMG